MSECVNLIPKNGELVNILPPKEIGITLPESDAVLVFYHRTSLFVHYIYRAVGGNTLFFIDADGTNKPLEGNYQDFKEARRAVFEYIEGWYNRKRIHSAIGYMTPQQREDEELKKSA